MIKRTQIRRTLAWAKTKPTLTCSLLSTMKATSRATMTTAATNRTHLTATTDREGGSDLSIEIPFRSVIVRSPGRLVVGRLSMLGRS